MTSRKVLGPMKLMIEYDKYFSAWYDFHPVYNLTALLRVTGNDDYHEDSSVLIIGILSTPSTPIQALLVTEQQLILSESVGPEPSILAFFNLL